MIVRGKHYRTAERIDIDCRDGRIVAIAPANAAIKADREAEFIAPGLFDLQINGALGISFNSATLDEAGVRKVVATCRQHGIARFCPTLITGSFEAIEHGFRTLQRCRERDPALARAMPGFHLEGPYLSGDDGPRGAHPKAHIRPPDMDEFNRWQDAAGGYIRLLTIAPEVPGAIPFIENLVSSGVTVAIGHSAASPETIREAIFAGARLSTHLGNGCHSQMDRHRNVIWEQLASDDLSASLIADGHHLPPSVVKSIIRAKTPARTILTCDASSLAGLPPGRYQEWGSTFEVQDGGRIVVPGTPFLAGSGVFLDDCVRNVVGMAGVSVAEAVDMATINPAKLLGFPVHTLEVGQPDEFFLLDFLKGKRYE